MSEQMASPEASRGIEEQTTDDPIRKMLESISKEAERRKARLLDGDNPANLESSPTDSITRSLLDNTWWKSLQKPDTGGGSGNGRRFAVSPERRGKEREGYLEAIDKSRYNGTMDAAVQVVVKHDEAGNVVKKGGVEVMTSAIHYDVVSGRSKADKQRLLDSVAAKKVEAAKTRDMERRNYGWWNVNALQQRRVYLSDEGNMEQEFFEDIEWWVTAAREYAKHFQNEKEQLRGVGPPWEELTIQIQKKDPNTNFILNEQNNFFDMMPDFGEITLPDGSTVTRKELLMKEMSAAYIAINRRQEWERGKKSGGLEVFMENPMEGNILESDDEKYLALAMGTDGSVGTVGDLMTHAENLFDALANCTTDQLVVIGPSGKEYELSQYFGYATSFDTKVKTREVMKKFLQDELQATEEEARVAFYYAESYAKIHGLFDEGGAKKATRWFTVKINMREYETLPFFLNKLI